MHLDYYKIQVVRYRMAKCSYILVVHFSHFSYAPACINNDVSWIHLTNLHKHFTHII
jgi:hypothetical protein